jgi:hypothetical protein
VRHVVAVSAGDDHSVALDRDHAVTCWGSDVHRQCTIPPALGNVIVAVGALWLTCTLSEDNKLVCWGHDATGRIPEMPNMLNVMICGNILL